MEWSKSKAGYHAIKMYHVFKVHVLQIKNTVGLKVPNQLHHLLCLCILYNNEEIIFQTMLSPRPMLLI